MKTIDIKGNWKFGSLLTQAIGVTGCRSVQLTIHPNGMATLSMEKVLTREETGRILALMGEGGELVDQRPPDGPTAEKKGDGGDFL